MDTEFFDVVQGANFPGLILLGLAGIPTLYFLVKWMVKFQREFTDFYVNENHKLRDRVDTLEDEVRDKDQQLVAFGTKVGAMENTIARHESTIEYHKSLIGKHQDTITQQAETIAKLNDIIDRRNLRREK